MSGTITFLVDDSAEEPFSAEHGLSLLIKHDEKNLLFDTGQGDSLFHNANLLGLSLSDLDALILSHGHYDHGGNIANILWLNPSLRLFAHPNCLIPRWSLPPGKEPKLVGLSEKDKSALLNHPPAKLHWCYRPIEITPTVWITGSIARNHSLEDVGGPFYEDKSGTVPDLLSDDLALWIEGDQGLTVLCGCCHSGVVNTIEHILAQYESAEVNTLLGGLHLLHATNTRLEKTTSFVNQTGIKRVVPAHCTGVTAMKMFRDELRAEVRPGTVGLQIRYN